MNKGILITGLDIGSSKIAAVAANVGEDGQLEIAAQSQAPSKGLSRGAIINLNETIDSVSAVLGKLRSKIGRSLDNIYVNISGEDLSGARSKGMAPISLRGREVTLADMRRCIEAASTIHLPFDREILHRIVQNFSVDDQPWIKNPLGLYASRLSCEVFLITANVNHIQNIYKCVNGAGYDIKDVVFTGIAESASLLDSAQKDGPSILIDFGASLTEFAIFYEEKLADLDVIPLGGADIKGSLKESDEFNKILDRINSKSASFLPGAKNISSITITGGLVFSDNIVELLEARLSCPVKMGVVKEIRGDISSIDSIRLATAIGLVKYAYEGYRKSAAERSIPRRISAKVIDIFNNYF